MNWKQEAVEKLRRYDSMRRAVINIPEEISRLKGEYSAIGTPALERIAASQDPRRREDRMMDNIVCRQELQWSLEQARQWMETVSRALGVLDPEERFVLHQLYMYPQTGGVEQICEKLGVEKTSVYRRRDKALQKFTIAMYGAAESN